MLDIDVAADLQVCAAVRCEKTDRVLPRVNLLRTHGIGRKAHASLKTGSYFGVGLDA
jgi:hypothetical protein